MEIKWSEELMRQATEVMIKGGELHFRVIKRGLERIPEILIYPDNRVLCDKETLTE